MKALKRIAATLLCICALLSLPGCGSVQATEKQIFAMNSAISIKAYGKLAQAGIDAASSVINSLDAALDPKREGSTAYAINNAQGQSVLVTGQVAEMLLTAKEVYSLSGGALDLTVYPLVKAWGFVDGLYRVPSESEIEGLLKNVGFSRVTLSAMSDSDSYLLTMPAGMELSFAAVGAAAPPPMPPEPCRSPASSPASSPLAATIQTLGDKPTALAGSSPFRTPPTPRHTSAPLT